MLLTCYYYVIVVILSILPPIIQSTHFDLKPSEPFTEPDRVPYGCYNFAPCKNPKKQFYVKPDSLQFFYYLTCSPDDCVCLDGTFGESCKELINSCETGTCTKQNYECINTLAGHKCVCKEHWGGDNCEIDLRTACRDKPCVNGECESTDLNSFTCKNCGDFSGKRCQYAKTCTGSTCKNGGTCNVLGTGYDYVCKCPPGFQGRHCEDKSVQYESPVPESCIYWDDDFNSWTLCSNLIEVTKNTCQKCLEDNPDFSYIYFGVGGNQCRISKTLTIFMNETTSTDCSDGIDIYLHDKYESDIETIDNGYCKMGTPYAILKTNDGRETACVCKPGYIGPKCDIDQRPCSTPGICVKGNCKYINEEEIDYVCECNSNYHGKHCELQDACLNNKCMYGSTCVDNNNDTYRCDCLPNYDGKFCENVKYCSFENRCQNNATCVDIGSGIHINYRCDCDAGWEGDHCEANIDDCLPVPCAYNSTCEDEHLGFKCICVEGTTGHDCSINIDDCIGVECAAKDAGAKCVDLLADYYCSCTENWVGEFCDLHVVIRDVLETIYGTSSNRTLITLLDELMKNPTQIKDMVPFIIGLETYDKRMELSWETEEILEWAAYENKMLNLKKDFIAWNDVVLGNCFTFNNFSDNSEYKTRSAGENGGLHVLLNVNTREYQPWIETSAIMVFVHHRHEYIFSESVRYNAEPNGIMQLFVSDKRYKRLNGAYGKCVNEPSQVKAYYYDGIYTTDGCLRSCYQIMIKEKCDCMDPRYPLPEIEKSCKVSDMTCIEQASFESGNPTTWPWCVCPLPCENQQYSVQWARSKLPDVNQDCKNTNACLEKRQDAVLVTVHMQTMEYNLYAEEPAMDLNRFISNLGGLLGVLMGISIVSFVEIAIMVFTVCYYCISG